MGGHVAEYMDSLEEENEEAYKRQFSRYIKAGIDSESLEESYKKAHAAIRADPSPKAKVEKTVDRRDGTEPRSATPSDEHVLPKSRLPSSEPKKQKSKYAPLFYIVRVIRTGVKHLYMSSSVV